MSEAKFIFSEYVPMIKTEQVKTFKSVKNNISSEEPDCFIISPDNKNQLIRKRLNPKLNQAFCNS